MKNISIEYDEEEGELKLNGSFRVSFPILRNIRSSIDDAAETAEGLVIFGAFSTKSLIESAEEGKLTEDLLELGSSLFNPLDKPAEF